MKIVAVNGRRFSVDLLSRAIADSKDHPGADGIHRRQRRLFQRHED
jgi:hypothetical protein